MIVRKWYNLLMLERLIIGCCLIFMLDINLQAIFTIAIFLLFIILTAIFKPYVSRSQNIRFITNMAIAIIIQAIYLVYRMQPLQNKAKSSIWTIMPIIVCVLLLICIIYNAIFLILSIYNFCVNKSGKKLTKK